MKARNTKRVTIRDGKPVVFISRPAALAVNGVVVTPTDHATIWSSINNGDKD